METESDHRPTRAIQIIRVGQDTRAHEDLVAVEEPMEIRLAFSRDGGRSAQSLSITMRTPGDDFDLALGFLFTEGIIRRPPDVREVTFCGVPKGATRSNVVRVELQDHVTVDLQKLKRHFYTTSSCGVCGKTSLDAVAATSCPVLSAGPVLAPELITSLPDKLRAAQQLFEATGGLHAAGWFDEQGLLHLIREDVGRHNAVDKVIGAALVAGRLPLSHGVLAVSGRASFELVQKAVMASIPIMVAVGAPSSLAIDLACRHHLTLIGFTKTHGFNIYAAPDRVAGVGLVAPA